MEYIITGKKNKKKKKTVTICIPVQFRCRSATNRGRDTGFNSNYHFIIEVCVGHMQSVKEGGRGRLLGLYKCHAAFIDKETN